jgi:hypothetical protein
VVATERRVPNLQFRAVHGTEKQRHIWTETHDFSGGIDAVFNPDYGKGKSLLEHLKADPVQCRA